MHAYFTEVLSRSSFKLLISTGAQKWSIAFCDLSLAPQPRQKILAAVLGNSAHQSQQHARNRQLVAQRKQLESQK